RRIFAFELGARGAVADHDLAAGKIEREERFDVLLDGNTPDIEPDRTRERQVGAFYRAEFVDVDTARPDARVGETVRFELAPQSVRRHHHRVSGRMKPAQQAI